MGPKVTRLRAKVLTSMANFLWSTSVKQSSPSRQNGALLLPPLGDDGFDDGDPLRYVVELDDACLMTFIS